MDSDPFVVKNTVRLTVKARHNRLLIAREKLGFSQKEMAAYCDVPFELYGQAERLQYTREGRWTTGAIRSTLRKIADALDVPADQLFPEWAGEMGRALKDAFVVLDDLKMVEAHDQGQQKLLMEDCRVELEAALSSLPKKRTAEVIRMYFGIGGQAPHTLQEIGFKMNLTRETIRMIKEKGIRQLRYVKRSGNLRQFLGEL